MNLKKEGIEQDCFGCEFCAGVGYEDYPLRKKPCRIPGHQERHEGNVRAVNDYLNANPFPEPELKPKGNWEWTGRGWKNLDCGSEVL